MDRDRESMKRVLMGLKSEARSLRRKELGDRLSPIAEKQDEAVEEVKLPDVGPIARAKPKSLQVLVAQAAPNEEMAEESVEGTKKALGDDDEDLQRVLKKFNL